MALLPPFPHRLGRSTVRVALTCDSKGRKTHDVSEKRDFDLLLAQSAIEPPSLPNAFAAGVTEAAQLRKTQLKAERRVVATAGMVAVLLAAWIGWIDPLSGRDSPPALPMFQATPSTNPFALQ